MFLTDLLQPSRGIGVYCATIKTLFFLIKYVQGSSDFFTILLKSKWKTDSNDPAEIIYRGFNVRRGQICSGTFRTLRYEYKLPTLNIVIEAIDSSSSSRC